MSKVNVRKRKLPTVCKSYTLRVFTVISPSYFSDLHTFVYGPWGIYGGSFRTLHQRASWHASAVLHTGHRSASLSCALIPWGGPGGFRAAGTSWLISSALSSGLYSYYHFPFLPWQGKGWNYWWNNVKTSWSLGDDLRCCRLKHLSDAFCCCLGIGRRVIPLQVTWKEMLWANSPRLWAGNMQSWTHSGLWKCRS